MPLIKGHFCPVPHSAQHAASGHREHEPLHGCDRRRAQDRTEELAVHHNTWAGILHQRREQGNHQWVSGPAADWMLRLDVTLTFICRKIKPCRVARWSEQLVVYPRTNKQNQKKKRKVEPATSQVGSPHRSVQVATKHGSAAQSCVDVFFLNPKENLTIWWGSLKWYFTLMNHGKCGLNVISIRQVCKADLVWSWTLDLT